jgi:hypothetical protein
LKAELSDAMKVKMMVDMMVYLKVEVKVVKMV